MLQGFFQITLTLLLVVVLSPILGSYFAQVFMSGKTFLDPVMNPVEQIVYLVCGVEPEEDMTGQEYAIAVLLSNSVMGILVFLLLMFQG